MAAKSEQSITDKVSAVFSRFSPFFSEEDGKSNQQTDTKARNFSFFTQKTAIPGTAKKNQTEIVVEHCKAESKRDHEELSSRGSFNSTSSQSHDLVEENKEASPSRKSIRLSKFQQILVQPTVDMNSLREIAWSGIPSEVRATTWKLLLGYLPANIERRSSSISRKRQEYLDCIVRYYDLPASERSDHEFGIMDQILRDIPRTAPDIPLFQTNTMQRLMTRVLYIWALKHPATGYVQGFNDLATPFFYIFLKCHVPSGELSLFDPAELSEDILNEVEADTYWCLAKLLDGIQNNYTHDQPGIQRMVLHLEELIRRVDSALFNHLEANGIMFMQFAYKWMNCLLMRDLSLHCIIRLWDTYFAEGSASFPEQLKSMPLENLMMFIQSPPTTSWTEADIDVLLSKAYVLSSLFKDAPSHLSKTQS